MQAAAAPKPDDKIGFGAIVAIAQKVVAERFGPNAKNDQQDMLGSFVAHGVTQQECESESLLQILAGADSTATTVRCTFLYILKPSCLCEASRRDQRRRKRGEDLVPCS
jgi:cytochrome P450